MKRYAFDPRVPYDPSGGWSREQCDPGCCWRDEDTECPVEHDSEQHIYIKYAKYDFPAKRSATITGSIQ